MDNCIGNSNSTLCLNKVKDAMGVFDSQVINLCLSLSLQHLYEAISFLFFLFGIFGNVLFIAVTTRSYQNLSTTDLFLVGLAGFDVIATIFLPFIYFLEMLNYVSYTDASCRFLALMHQVSILGSIYVLLFTVYSFYRKIILRKPDDERRKLRFYGLFTFSIILSAVSSFVVISDMKSSSGFCHFDMKSFTTIVLYEVVLFILEIIIPILIFTIFFAQIGVELHQDQEIQQTDLEADVALIERARNRRKLQLLIAITCMYYMFLLPYVFVHLYMLLNGGPTIGDSFNCFLYDVLHLIICCKCFVNPIIYLFGYEGFRENIKRVVRGLRIGRRYNFMHVKYNFRREDQDLVSEVDVPSQEDGHMLSEMTEWKPWQPVNRSPSPPNPEVALDDKDHDYDEEEEGTVEDNVAILRPWRNLRSTSAL